MSPAEFARQGIRALLGAMGLQIRGMHQAAYLLALAALLSQLLALLRDRLLAGTFGAGPELDLYYAAFRVPDLLFATVASLLSLYALLPILSRYEARGEGVGPLIRGMLLLFFCAMGAVAAVLFFLSPWLIGVVAPGLSDNNLLLLTRILLLQPILLGASNILASLTQLRHRFILYSISPLLYNVGIILGLLFLYPQMGLAGLAWGVVLGAAAHLLVQLPFFAAEGGPRVAFQEAVQSLREVLKLSIPRTLALSANQFSLLALTALASLFAAGSITVLTFAINLSSVPLAIIGVSYSVAAFPTLSRLIASGERSEFLRHVEAALRHVLFWAIPATVFVIVLRAQLVRTILGSGAFDWDATRLVAAALALLIISLSAQSVTLLLSRAYYAAGFSLRPLFFAIASFATVAASAALLTLAFHYHPLWRYFLESMLRVADLPGTTVLMLALAYCLGTVVQAALALFFFSRDFSFSLAPLRRLAFESFAAATLGGAVAYRVLAYLGDRLDLDTASGVMVQGAVAGVSGLMVTGVLLALLRNRELVEAAGALQRRLIKEPPAIEATDVS